MIFSPHFSFYCRTLSIEATQNPWSKSSSLTNVYFFASVLHLTQLYSAQMFVPEPPNAYVETLTIVGGISKYASNNTVSLLLLMQLICLTDNYLCLISNLIVSGFNFQLLAPVQFCSSGLKHLLTPHVLVLQIFVH